MLIADFFGLIAEKKVVFSFFALLPQVNFPTNNLNLRWRWWDQIQTIFLNLLYFIKTKIKLSSQHFKQCRNYWIGMFRCYFFCYNCSYLSKFFFACLGLCWFITIWIHVEQKKEMLHAGCAKTEIGRKFCCNFCCQKLSLKADHL